MNPNIARVGEGKVMIGGREYLIRKQMLDDFRKHDLPATLAKLSKPALLFHSLTDETLGYDHAMRLYSVLMQSELDQQSATSLITLPAADHLLTNHEADANFVADIIATWCTRLVEN